MHHLSAFYASAAAFGTVDNDTPAVVDGVIPVNASNHLIMPNNSKILAAYILGASVTRARVRAPSLVGVAPPYMVPANRAAAVPTLPPLVRYKDMGPSLVQLDEVAMLLTNNLGASTEAEYAGLWLEMPGPPLGHGPTYTVRATSSTTVTANAWSLCTLAFDYTLPGGRYCVTGMRAIGANGLFARLLLPGYTWRPGCVMAVAVGNDDWSYFRNGNLGSYGEFDSTAIPTLEVFAIGAQTSQEVYLDIIKIR